MEYMIMPLKRYADFAGRSRRKEYWMFVLFQMLLRGSNAVGYTNYPDNVVERFVDEAAASATILGGLGASGWHSCCLLMRMIADGFVLDSASMGAPGVDEVRWLKPLRPGTRIRIRATVLDTRPSSSRPEMGLVKYFFEVLDDADAVLTTLRASFMLGRRAPGAAA
jgi:hypothetical protein